MRVRLHIGVLIAVALVSPTLSVTPAAADSNLYDYTVASAANSFNRESTTGSQIVTDSWVDLPFVFYFHQENALYDPAKQRVFVDRCGALFFDGTGPAATCFAISPQTEAEFASYPTIAPKWIHNAASDVGYSVTYSRGPADSFVRFRWTNATDTFDALLYVDGRIRFDYGPNSYNDMHWIGLAKGNPFVTDYKVVSHNDDSTDMRTSYVWTPVASVPPGFALTLEKPEAASIYIDGVKQAQTISGAHYATAAGSVPLKASASGAVGTVTVEIYVGTQLRATASGTGSATASATWTPTADDLELYTVRAVATMTAGTVTKYREVFATSQIVPIGTLLTPVVALVDPNGEQWIDGTDGYYEAGWQLTSACTAYDVTMAFSKDDGRTYSSYKTLTGLTGPVNAAFVYPLPTGELAAFDSAEAKMKVSIAVPTCGGNPARVVSDASDDEFVIDVNGRTARVDANPPTNTVVNGYYTAPLGFSFDGSSSAGFSRVSLARDGAAPVPAAAYVDEFGAVGDNAAGTHWRWIQTPLSPLTIEVRRAEWIENDIYNPSTPDIPVWLPKQGPSAIELSYNVPASVTATSPAVAARDLPVTTDTTGFDTVELWVFYDSNAEITGDLTVRLRSGATELATLTDTLVAGQWKRLNGAAPSGVVDNLRVELHGSVAGSEAPAVVFQSFTLDGLRAVKDLQESTDGIHSWKARVTDAAGIEESTSEPVPLDLLRPTGSLNVNNGAAITNSLTVSLQLAATDTVSGVAQMQISNDATFTGAVWETYATTKSWILPPLGVGETEAVRYVYARFKDGVGRISDPPSVDFILVDPTLPTFGAAYSPGEAWLGSAAQTLSLDVTDNVALDGASAKAGFGNTPAGVSYQTATFTGSSAAGTISRSVTAPEGRNYAGFRIRDTAGNQATITKQLNVDLSAPTAAINIVQDSTNSRTVQLVLTSQDLLSGVKEYRVGNAPGEGAWTPVSASAQANVEIDLDWTLPDADGRRYVYVQFKDAVGHTSAEASDSVILDRRGPIITPVSPAPGSTGVPFSPLSTPTIQANWQDDTSASTAVVGVNELTGRIWLRNDNLPDAPPAEYTELSTRTKTDIKFKPAALNPCTQYTVIVTVSDQLGNPSAETQWLFVTGCT